MKPNKSRYILLLQNYWPLFGYILISVVFLFPVLSQKGIPFQYDWSWPIFDMKYFWHDLAGNGNLGILNLPGKYASLLFGIPGLLNIGPETSLKLFLLLSHIVASYSFYVFVNKKIKSKTVSFIAGLVYGFSPYIFIRTIVGFVPSILAYAVLPIFLLKFWQTKKKVLDYLMIGLLLSWIFWQPQAGLLTFFIITVYTIVSLLGKQRIADAKNYLFSLLSLGLFSLPWLIIMLFKNGNPSSVSGSAVTTLGRMSSLPHSYRNMLMLSDHEITTAFFYPFSHDKIILAGFVIIWFVALCALFSKKNRQMVLALFISSLLVIPFYKGPAGLFGSFYRWFYSHLPQVMVFRETYHFEFLFAITLCVMFAVGLDVIWTSIDHSQIFNFSTRGESSRQFSIFNKFKIKNIKKGKKNRVTGSQIHPSHKATEWHGKSGMTTRVVNTGLKTLFAGSVIFIVAPYLTFDYAGYSPTRQIPSTYNEFYNYLQNNKDVCHKIYYPPGLDFLYFKGDTSLGASNGDSIAGSIGIPFVNGGTSILNTPSSEMFYQDELISQFFEAKDNGEFADLLNKGGIDCVVVRQDIDTKYAEAMGLTFEKDAAMLKKWNQNDWLAMTESKKDLTLEKQFGENIFIFKPELNPNSSLSKSNVKSDRTGQSATEQFSGANGLRLTAYDLPIIDWADVNSDYRDGWSRGRYAFWRKPLFAQLRQDFIYTTREDSILSGKISQNGSYDLWVRYLTGGTAGSWQLVVGSIPPQTADSKPPTIIKDSGEERFVWKNLGNIDINNGDVSIKNISGENAIADLVLVKR